MAKYKKSNKRKSKKFIRDHSNKERGIMPKDTNILGDDYGRINW